MPSNKPPGAAPRKTAAGARVILITHDAPASIVAARPDEPSGPRPTESRHGVPWAEAHAVRQAVGAPLGGALRQRGAARGTALARDLWPHRPQRLRIGRASCRERG